MKKYFPYLILLLLSVSITSCQDNSNKTDELNSNPSAAQSGPFYFVHLSDIHLDLTKPGTKFKEDTGTDLWTAAKGKLDSLVKSNNPPKFFVFTGDLPAHGSCACYIPDSSRKPHNDNIQAVLTDLEQLLAPKKIPLFYVPGNNDGLAGDYRPFTDDVDHVTPFSLVRNDHYPVLNAPNACGSAPCWISYADTSNGYYAAKAMDNLRIIGLNSIILGSSYYPQYISSGDTASVQLREGNKQMAWLGQQLKDAETAGDKVYLIMHIPPGLNAYSSNSPMWAQLPNAKNPWVNQFLDYMHTYSKTVTGVLYGHTHMEELRLIYDKSGIVNEVAISAPGITPNHENNPGFKIVYFDPVSKELTDFVTYYTAPSSTKWGFGKYSFSQNYGCNNTIPIVESLRKMKIKDIQTKMDVTYYAKSPYPGLTPPTDTNWIKVKY